MTDYSKITALYSRLSVGDEDRDGGESNSIQNQKIFLENYLYHGDACNGSGNAGYAFLLQRKCKK